MRPSHFFRPNSFLFFSGFFFLILAGWSGCGDYQNLNLAEESDFNFHIRPILSNNCFTCHGPDPSSREGGLRLDLRDSAIAVLSSGNQAIVPGNWRKSELIRRITSDDPSLQMPPPEMKKKLNAREIELLKKWIAGGAEWKPYWAFIPPEKKAPPKIRNRQAGDHVIDRFIIAELEKRDLQPAPAAARPRLLRRLSYLLTGLPPTPAEIDHFMEDQTPNAYEKQVDRLLASPHFGERWARHWLDLMRYAETKGHEFDYPVVGAWRYRDYLIRAFNQDVPYDQLIREHLAGDLLPQPRSNPEEGFNESILATIHFSLGEGKHSPVDTRVDEAERIDNIIDVTTKSFQALTVACARCHDHKFDAIPTADYYALYGILESTRFTVRPAMAGPRMQEKIDSIEQYKKAVRRLLAEKAIDRQAPLAQAHAIAQKNAYTPPEAAGTYQIIGDFRNGSLDGWFSDGPAFNNRNALGNPVFQNGLLMGFETGKASSRIVSKGLQGALRSPNFTIERDRLAVRAGGEYATIRIITDNFQLIQYPIHGGLKAEVQEPAWQEYLFDVAMWKGQKAYIEILPGRHTTKNGKNHDFLIQPNAWIEAEWAIAFDGELPQLPPPAMEQPLPAANIALQNWVNGQVTPADVVVLEKLLAQGKLPKAQAPLPELLAKTDQLGATLYDSTTFAGVTEGDAIFSPVFIRGSTTQLSEQAEPHRFFTALASFRPPFSQTGSGRLDLANAIASPDNPLTARVMVNRIWHHLFGTGIVKTVDNFGLQGKTPSHPALLDYLAIRFVEEGWSVKKMIRAIVLSQTFQQSTETSDEQRQADPQNLWLAHYPVRRLEGEAIRDGILAASGQLDPTLYGESFPVHLTEFMKGRGRPPVSGPVDGYGRRSIYQAIQRNFLPPLMLTFDMPVPFSTFGRRNVSNVPAQSLTLMNDPFVVEQANCWAESLLAQNLNFAERITTVYRSAFARPPQPAEVEQARQFFTAQADSYRLTDGQAEEDLRIWADFCHAVFNMKEFIYLL